LAIILLVTGWHSGDRWFFTIFGGIKDSPAGKGIFLALHLSLGVTLFVLFLSRFSLKDIFFGLLFTGFLGILPFPHGLPLKFHLERRGSIPSPPFPVSSPLSDWGCRTCHLSLEGKKGEDLHKIHRSFSCITCHRGSGGTLFPDVAHGRARWSVREPLLTGVWIQSSCNSCHPLPPSKGADLIKEGERLWKEGGCSGCHGDPEERLGPELRRMAGAVGMEPLSSVGWDLVHSRGYPPHAAFFAEAIVDPKSHLPFPLSPSAMPNSMPVFSYSPRELSAITLKVLSLRDWGYPPSLTVSSRPPLSVNGAELFRDPEKGCIACHRFLGEGGDLAPPLDPWIGREADKLTRILLDPDRPPVPGYPPQVMPRDYGKRLTKEELALLVEYIVRGKETP
jgi:mono/diheme cytochrome c family protein